MAGAHAVAVDLLPPIHRDPFDRILVAQAQIEGITFLTADIVPSPLRELEHAAHNKIDSIKRTHAC